MSKIKSIIVLMLLFSIMALLFSSCATIFGSKKNTIEVLAGSPENAEIYLDGKFLGETPFKARISKFELQVGSIIEIKKENYITKVYEVSRKAHVGYVAADIIGGVIPLVVDVATGNIYRPNTRKIEYELVKLKTEKKSLKTQNHQKKIKR